MARYTQESREKVRDAIDFAELVGARTELKRSGTNRLQGLCPFHEERTPSFGIDPVEKLYHCFGCGAGGDVFSFVMETEGLDFGAALEWLAERAGVELERESEDPRDAAKRVRRDRLLALLERTAAYYVRVLWEGGEAAGAREYLLGRGLDEATLREFRVGYSPSRWDRVLMASRKAGFSEEELLAAGLASRSRDGSGRLFDRFRGRIMFPLADERGRVLGFGARALGEGQQPKYLNTSDGEVFHKGRMVYGADLARAAAAKAGRVVLVEGYTDVIALRQAGVPEAVCSMGTALTPQQVDALARLAPRVLFCQDPDAAGQKAVGRGLEGLAEHNSDRRMGTKVDFRIVRLPAGQDPADVVQASGADAMRRLLDERRGGAALPGRARAGRRPHGHRRARRRAQPRRRGDRAARPERAALRADQARLRPPERARDARGERDRRPGAPPPRRPGGRDRRGRAPPARAQRRRARRRPARAGRGRRPGRRGTTRPVVHEDPGPEEGFRGPNGAHKVLDRREQTERAFLSYCLALPAEGEQRLGRADLDELFAAPMTRRAAEYLRGRLRTPAADLPPGDEPLARLVAELVIRAGQLEATPAKLELEALQLELSRLDRLIAGARVSGGEGMRELATERQVVLDAIRHRLTLAPIPSATRTSVRTVMDADWLRSRLESGRSIESIAREAGKHPSTVAYWVNKHGLIVAPRATPRRPRPDRSRAARGAARRGPLDPAMAERLDRSYATVRHWLAQHGLAHAARVRLAETAQRAPQARTRSRRRARCTVRRCSSAAARTASAAGCAASERSTAGAGDQARPGRRGRRGCALCGYDRVDRRACSSITSTRARRRSRSLARHDALARRGARRGREVRPAVRELPCGGRGGVAAPP